MHTDDRFYLGIISAMFEAKICDVKVPKMPKLAEILTWLLQEQ